MQTLVAHCSKGFLFLYCKVVAFPGQPVEKRPVYSKFKHGFHVILKIYTMKTAVAYAALFLWAIFQTLISAGQCVIYPVSIEQRVARSSGIAQGKVIEKHTYLDQSGNVYTLNKVKINAWLKNHSTADEIQVITAGGIYNDKATIVYPSLQLDEQWEYLFFLEGNNFRKDDKTTRSLSPSSLQTMIYADMQGAIKNEGNNYHDFFARSAVTEAALFARVTKLAHSRVLTPAGKEFNARKAVSSSNAKVLSVTGFSPATVNGGTILPGDVITITGAAFGAAPGSVFFSNADNGGSSFVSSGVASDILSWSDNSIDVKVPSRAGTGPVMVSAATNMVSGSSLTVGYTLIELNSNFSGFAQTTRQRYYLRNLNGSGGYTFLFNTTFNANTNAVNAYNRAMATWRNSTGLNFVTGGTTATASVAADGVNAVFFDGTLPAGVLGLTTSHFSGSATGGCNNANTVWWASDIDMQFAPDPPVAGLPWQFGPAAATISQVDFESVAVHELGHAAGLGHRIAPGEVMNWNISNGANIRVPSATERNGVTAKLSYSALPATTCFNPGTSGSPMTLAAITLPVTFISFTGNRKDNATNILNWDVSQATGNAGYAIERSADGNKFNQVNFIPDANSSSAEESYTATDDKAGIYPWYYRLRQVDINGNYSYSKTIFIKGDKNNAWRVFASPDGSSIHVYTNIAGNTATFQLLSSSGQEMMNKTINNSVIELPVNNLSKGIYHYRIIDNTNTIAASGSLLLGN
jgi:hypothetical protein